MGTTVERKMVAAPEVRALVDPQEAVVVVVAEEVVGVVGEARKPG
jgi:hypothetical protein